MDADVATAVIAGIAVAVSLYTFALTSRASERAERHSRMPVLTVSGDRDGWVVKNIGTGPALNVVIAQGCRPQPGDSRDCRELARLPDSERWKRLIDLRGEKARRRGGVAPGEVWCNPIHLRPIGPEKEERVAWNYSDLGAGISYTDALGNTYTMRTSAIGSRVTERQCIPVWEPSEWVQLSQVQDRTPGDVWGRRPARDP